MDGFLDIYTRLTIGIISFIAPMTVYLLSMFSDGIAIIRRRSETERIQVGDLLRAAMPIGVAVEPKIVKNSNDSLNEIEARNNRRINLLTPTRQILRIFIPLFLSLLFIMIYKIFKDPNIVKHNPEVCLGLFILSLVSFIIGLLVLWQVVRAVIDTKLIMGRERADIPVGIPK